MAVSRCRANVALWIGTGCVAVLGTFAPARGSDHQDTPEVEVNSRCDINDVYAFPNPTNPDRICLVMTTSSPILPPQKGSAAFDPDKLYQIKIDNTGDAVEDLVLQFAFDGTTPAVQTVELRGPAAPVQTGRLNKILADTVAVAVSGNINASLGSATSIQLFCGLKDDPFFIDLEQFFRIIPDRRPSRGALAMANPISPAAWRDPGIDYLGVNDVSCLAIVVEMPESLIANGTTPIGIWGTISR